MIYKALFFLYAQLSMILLSCCPYESMKENAKRQKTAVKICSLSSLVDMTVPRFLSGYFSKDIIVVFNVLVVLFKFSPSKN